MSRGALLWVANIDEPRVYGEAIVLLYLPVAAAARGASLRVQG